MLISYQILANPVQSESGEVAELSVRHIFPNSEYALEKLEQLLSNNDQYEAVRRSILNKLTKRRAQAKANLAGLWGVPTRFA